MFACCFILSKIYFQKGFKYFNLDEVKLNAQMLFFILCKGKNPEIFAGGYMLKQIRDTGSLPVHAFVIYYDEFLVKTKIYYERNKYFERNVGCWCSCLKSAAFSPTAEQKYATSFCSSWGFKV